MKMLRTFCLALPLAVIASALNAQPVTLAADEIEGLLAGNTVVGLWSGTPYRQYFDPAGQTFYVPDGGRPERGRWRVNGETDMYESHWERSGWSSYGVSREGEVLFWVESDGDMQAFTIEPGRNLSDN